MANRDIANNVAEKATSDVTAKTLAEERKSLRLDRNPLSEIDCLLFVILWLIHV